MQSEPEIIKNKFLEKKQILAQKGIETPSNRELLEGVIRERMENSGEQLTSSNEKKASVPFTPSSVSQSSFNKSENKADEAQNILQELVKTAIEKSIPQAVLEAKKMRNDFLLDRLHDVLVDKYYQMLKNKGVI